MLAYSTPSELAALDRDLAAFPYDWPSHARANQLPPPGDWRVWLLSAGRGFGKSRTGAEWVRAEVEAGRARRVALVAPTSADARDVMVEGESGLLACCPPWNRPHYEPSKRRVTWPNGAMATLYSGEEPDRLRGPQHDCAWCDEIATWAHGSETWDMLLFGLRLGGDPRVVVTTTPRPVKLVRDLMEQATTVITKGTTYENRANLAPAFLEQIIRRYEGTRLGRQELNAELLEDNPDALWQRGQIEALRVTKAPSLTRIVVGVDPQAGDGEEGAETGIVVAGLGEDGHGYVLDDRSLRASPLAWASAAVTAYHTHRADRIIAEANQGGAMVESTIRTAANPSGGAPVKLVHASRGKVTRAEPISALYELGKCHHVGTFPQLEDQLCLAADTRVLTLRGWVRIDTVRAGDYAWTRSGWNRVRWAGMTAPAARLYAVTTEEDVTLLATAGHPVYTHHRGFVPVAELAAGDTLETIGCTSHWTDTEDGAGEQRARMDRRGASGNMVRRLSGTGRYGGWTTAAIIATPSSGASCTGPSGRRRTDLSRPAPMFTTGTGTGSTTTSPTWSSSRLLSISLGMSREGFGPGTSTAVLPKRSASGTNGSRTSSFAWDAGPLLRAPACGRLIAAVPAGAARITSVEPVPGSHPVYNLEVEEVHEFFANGILVHNCEWVPGEASPDRMDALVWALTELIPARRLTGLPSV